MSEIKLGDDDDEDDIDDDDDYGDDDDDDDDDDDADGDDDDDDDDDADDDGRWTSGRGHRVIGRRRTAAGKNRRHVGAPCVRHKVP